MLMIHDDATQPIAVHASKIETMKARGWYEYIDIDAEQESIDQPTINDEANENG